jgi:hypothetical protein
MQLSPFTHYYVHKLLREYIDSFNCLRVESMSSHPNSQVDLNKAMCGLYPEQKERFNKFKELEFLTAFCQEMEKDKYQQESVGQIKQQIFQLLGFNLIAIWPEQAPTILPEESAHRFCVYQADSVRECVRHDNEFYGLAHNFEKADRLQAYQFAWALVKQEIPAILTVSAARYVIWVRLRSPAYTQLSKQGNWLLKMVLPLYSTLTKFKQVVAYQLPKPVAITAATEILDMSRTA